MLRTQMRWGASFLIGLGLLTARPSAACAGPVEAYGQVLLNERLPDTVVLRYGYGATRYRGGLLISHDRGRSFALTCGDAIAPGLNATAALLGADGLIALGTFDGLLRDDGQGCDFRADPSLAGRWITDLAADPRDPQVLFALASSTNGSSDNGLFRSVARGRFEPLGASDDMVLTRLRVVERRDSGLRFYVSAIAPVELDPAATAVPPADYRLRVSDDEGATWREHRVDGGGGIVRLQAVDPGEPDRLLISIERSEGPDTLLISEDGGATFAPYLTLVSLSGLVQLPDGRLFIADDNEGPPGDGGGLWRAESFGAPAELVTDAYAVHCLGAAADGSLLACQRIAFGLVDPQDGTFTARFALDQLDALVSCPGSDVRTVCKDTLLSAYCGLSHFPCAPVCDAYGVDLGPLVGLAADDAKLMQCLARRGLAVGPKPSADANAPANAGRASPRPPDMTMRAPPRSAPGGCGAASTRGGAASSSLLVAVALLAIVQRRARRTRRAQRQSER